MKNILFTIITFLLMTVPAWASTARVDNSGFLVWSFLGFCAMIIVAQVIPAVMVTLGIVKAVKSEPDTVTSK